ncbi:beta-galactosidase trimerization domain-containing protein [Bacteroidota bacterium]
MTAKQITILLLSFFLLHNLMAQNPQNQDDQWFRNSYRKLFFDYHTFQAAKDVAIHFDAEKWAYQLEESHVQAVSLHALCYRGWRYYRKGEVGYTHPKLPEGVDIIGQTMDACRKRDIKVIAYFNVCGGEAAKMYHPDWIMTDDEGNKQRKVSLFSPYFEEFLLPILEEFTTNYKVDGLFFDFLYVSNEHDVHAKKKYCRDTGKEYPNDEESPNWSHYIGWLLKEGKRIRHEAIEAVHRGNPSTLVAINWSYTHRQPEIPPENLGFLSLDVLPYDQVYEASFIAKNWVTLGKPFDIMNSAFLQWWGDWGVKPAETMKQECAAAMANGGRTWIGYQIRPEFDVEPALMNEFRKTFEFVKEREDICNGAKVIPYIAILNSSAGHFTHKPLFFVPDQSLRGAHKMLLESGFHFNILEENTLKDDLEKYKAVILPDQRYISPDLATALKGFVRDGGIVIGTSYTSTQDITNNFTGQFQLGDLFGIEQPEKYEHNHAFIVLQEDILNEDVLNMPQQSFGESVLFKPTKSKVLADLWEPLVMDDGRYVHSSSPQGKYTGSPAITINEYGKGKAIFLGNDIFQAYSKRPQWNLKNMFRNLLNMTIEDKLIEMDAPSSVEVILAEKGSTKQVHLVNHYREKSSWERINIAEHVLPIYDIGVKVKTERKPGSVKLMPEGTALDFKFENEQVSFTVPKLHIYSIVCIE